MLNVVRRSLVVVILLHRTAHYRELVNATRADSRSSFTAKDYLLRQFLVILLILVRAVVKSSHIHCCSNVIVDYGIRIVHTLCYRTGRIFTVANVLQEASQLHTWITWPLVGHFIAHAPHHHTRIATELVQQVDQVFFGPFVKEFVVTVIHFGGFPFVERFHHDHHTHFVTSADKLGSWHVVRCTYGVATHIFQQTYLATYASLVGNTSKRAKVVVVAHATEVGMLAIQEEALAWNNLY